MTRTILTLRGDDRIDFLQGLVTNDVAGLADGKLVYAALLTPQGKYLADFFLVPLDAETIGLDVATDLAQAVGRRLMMYRLRAKVDIAASEIAVGRGLGEAPEGAFADPRDPALGWRIYGPDAADQGDVDWDAVHVDAMVPQTGKDLSVEDSYILENRFEALSGVDFRKGCYVGQEVTARMKHKTELKKGLVRLSVDGAAAPGDALETEDGKPAGRLGTVAGGRALAHVRFDRAKGGLRAGDARLSLLED